MTTTPPLSPAPLARCFNDDSGLPEILLIDADPASRSSLQDLLAPVARVEAVASGGEGLQHASSRELAAILIDVHLPDADGFAIVTELRRSPITRNVPVLFLSHAPPDWLTERRGYALGALGYLTKPVDAQALRARLEVLLTLFRHGAELRRREQMIVRQHAEILEAKAALEQVSSANRAKDLYMGVLGHDLRSPLAAILMSSRMMLMRKSLAPDDRESIARIARNGERMAALIRDIIDYTRGQSLGGIPVVPRPTDMGEICRAMIEEVGLLHSDREMHFVSHGELRGYWDRERVEQVISNLLTNSLHHGKGAIHVRAEGTESEVWVSVHNHGDPIPPEQMPHLFEPFHRGAHTSAGLGLGLYIVSEIMRAHDGSVQVVSAEGTGTSFKTRWPRVATL